MKKTIRNLAGATIVAYSILSAFGQAYAWDITVQSPTKVEHFTNAKGESISKSTYADGQTTFSNNTQGFIYWGNETPSGLTPATESQTTNAQSAWNTAPTGGNAAENSGDAKGASSWSWKTDEKKSEESYVLVTESIPGANCIEHKAGNNTKRLYKCTVWQGFDTVTGMLGSLIRYATYLTGLIGVLMIVLSGIQYSLSGGGEDAKKAKGRIIQLATGLVLLFLTGMILNTVAPWIYN